MNECSDCKQAVLVAELTKKVMTLEKTSAEREKEIAELKKDVAVGNQKTAQVFDILNDIKNSLQSLVAKVSMLELKPAKRWEDTIKTIIYNICKIFYQKNAPEIKKNCTSFLNEMQCTQIKKGCKNI